ncbi:Aste57867_5089 [Aphanomyces stellatus]|uniref:Aste57867_5089 protein n=1 Tax=Aphanomyces stellatus TaxID=120398 RepID=A0A485KE71_9STRA|nr:hypothetical protein As57867_005076 [Aphanomyces stellatus]VFT82170.1 Aste57867_5089 [Aphanomyces stellatus]
MAETASHALRQFILDAQLLRSEGSIEWTLDGTAKDCHVQLYTGKTQGNAVVLAGATQVQGTLADAATICEQFPSLHGFDALESLAIASIETEMPFHHVAFQWMSMRSMGVVTHRDACVMEVRDMFTTDDGLHGFASLVQSIELPECPVLDTSHGLVRMHIQHTGYLFTQVQPNVLDVVHCIHVDFQGTLPTWLSKRYMKKRVATVATLDQYFKQLRHTDTSTAAAAGFVASHKQCGCCAKVFGTFESKRQCTVCHDKVCKLCYTTGLLPQLNKIMPLCIRCVLRQPSSASASHPPPATRPSHARSSSSSSSSMPHSPRHRPTRQSHPTPPPQHALFTGDFSNLYDATHDIVLHTPPEANKALDAVCGMTDDEIDHFLDSGCCNLIQLDIKSHLDDAQSHRTTSTTLDSLSDDGASSVVSAASTGVWKDAISHFHLNLRTFKENMDRTTDRRHSTASSILYSS